MFRGEAVKKVVEDKTGWTTAETREHGILYQMTYNGQRFRVTRYNWWEDTLDDVKLGQTPLRHWKVIELGGDHRVAVQNAVNGRKEQ